MGIPLEAAEGHWRDAKKAVTKGKRRGSWYWGKVINMFKRNMGMTEGITLREWIEAEDTDDEGN